MSVLHRLKSLSIKNIFDTIVAMVRRFPLVVLTTILGTSMGVYAIELGSVLNDNIQIAQKVLLMSLLGAPIFLALTLWRERFTPKEFIAWILQFGGIVFLTRYYFLLPKGPEDFSTPQIITLILLNVISWLLVLAVPFFKKENNTAHWRYIETLVIWFFVTGIFSATLFAGLALSLWAVDYLFSVNWDEETYVQLWSVIVGIFATWFFLCRFPKQPQELDKNFSFPAILRIFVQFILVPLLSIFYVILYAYTGKILVTQNWPLGGVAVWILAFSITGVITYLIGQPMIQHHEYPWLKKFFAFFFGLILPLTIVLFMSIGIRIQEYGVTEPRYLVVVFGLWLIAVALYYLLSKNKEIKFALLLTASVFLGSLVGPWSMFNVSVQSQYNRLQTLLIENKILVDGKIEKVDKDTKIDGKVLQSIRSQIVFLADHDAVDKIQKWFMDDLKQDPKDFESDEHRVRGYVIANNAMKEMGLDKRPTSYNDGYFSYSNHINKVIATETYEYFLQEIRFPYDTNMNNSGEKYFDLGSRKLQMTFAEGVLKVYENNILLGEKNLNEYAIALKQKYGQEVKTDVLANEMVVEIQNEKIQMKMYLSYLSGDEKEAVRVTYFNAIGFVSLK